MAHPDPTHPEAESQAEAQSDAQAEGQPEAERAAEAETLGSGAGEADVNGAGVNGAGAEEYGAQVESDSESESDAEAEPKPDPEEAQRTTDRLMWTSAWLTVLVGVFLIAGLPDVGGGYGALAWLGTVVAVLGLLTLIAVYVLCARDKFTLRTRLFGPIDVFKGSTVLVAIVVLCGLLAPTGTTSALAVLLPWAITYWLYGLEQKAQAA
ncbi:hypothetical protein [Kribbella sp. NPDC048915]|uniref:hypothetical protein n=1 Tax=Kribbella sp. NPDC048915 TaxID=3155148 RepID=UPI0033CC3DE8